MLLTASGELLNNRVKKLFGRVTAQTCWNSIHLKPWIGSRNNFFKELIDQFLEKMKTFQLISLLTILEELQQDYWQELYYTLSNILETKWITKFRINKEVYWTALNKHTQNKGSEVFIEGLWCLLLELQSLDRLTLAYMILSKKKLKILFRDGV